MHEEQDLSERETRTKAVQKALGEPFGLEFKEPVVRMRTHLLVCAMITIAATLLDLRIKPDVSFFGVQFEGLTEKKILMGLVAINFYLLFHFLWSSVDVFREWRLRRTGTMVAYMDTNVTNVFGDARLDFGNDPRQSTLYRWWRQGNTNMSSLPQTIASVDNKITKMMDAVIVELKKGQTPELVNWQTTFISLRTELKSLKETMEQTQNVISDERIPVSLERFDNSFKALLKSQNARWFFLEWLFPVALGCTAIGLIISKF